MRIPLYIIDEAIFLARVISRVGDAIGALAEKCAGFEPELADQLRSCEAEIIRIVNAIQDAVTPADEPA
jgi:hypothetical protein